MPLANDQRPSTTMPPSTGVVVEPRVGDALAITASGSGPQTSSCAAALIMPWTQLWLARIDCTHALEPQPRPISAATSTWS